MKFAESPLMPEAPVGKGLRKGDLKVTASAWAKRYAKWYCANNPDASWDWCETDHKQGALTWKTDLFKFADMLIVHEGMHLIQVTGGSNGLARVKKICGAIQPKEKNAEEQAALRKHNARCWLASHGTIQIWDYKKRSRDKMIYKVERVITHVTEDDLK